MTALDLDAVKARHGIRVAQNEYGRWIGWGWCLSVSYDHATEADAICALLKARWGIVTDHIADLRAGYVWLACIEPDFGLREMADTELAAAVALADRLREKA